MKEELVSGLKNAIQHGSSLEDSVNSFIGAGYPPAEVKEAAQSLTNGTLSLLQQESQSSPISQSVQPLPQVVSTPANQTQVQPPQESSSKGMKIAIIVLLLLIISFGIFMLLFPKS